MNKKLIISLSVIPILYAMPYLSHAKETACDGDGPQPAYNISPAPIIKITLQAGTLFDFDQSTLRPDGSARLDELADTIKSKPNLARVEIIGHTDSKGPEQYNLTLSKKRATAVGNHLIEKGVEKALVKIIGKGESEPLVSNITEAGRSKNRRVEVVIRSKTEAGE